jgi:sugar/nucleoside kinase (ribokinase family)
MRRLGVVGLVSLDRVDGGLPRLGGAPFYAARALRLLGRPAVVATKLADEDRRRLSALGLPVVAGSASRTIAFRIENTEGGRLLAIDELGEPWTPADARGWLGEALAGVDWLHAGGLTRADFPAETLALLARGRILSLDGQSLVRPGREGDVAFDADYDPDVLRYVGVLKLAREELEALALELDPRSLGSLGVREVAVTLGADGAAVHARGVCEHVPTRPLAGIDPTGAGDGWVAAYLVFRRQGHTPASAARLANGTAYALLAGRRAA